MSAEGQIAKILSALPSSSSRPIFAFFLLSDSKKVTARTMAIPKIGGFGGDE